jgi:hypothetical protein
MRKVKVIRDPAGRIAGATIDDGASPGAPVAPTAAHLTPLVHSIVGGDPSFDKFLGDFMGSLQNEIATPPEHPQVEQMLAAGRHDQLTRQMKQLADQAKESASRTLKIVRGQDGRITGATIAPYTGEDAS